MKKLFELRAKKRAELEALLGKAKTEERAFSEDEKKQFDALESEIKSLDATIQAEERAKGITDLKVPETAPKGEQLTQEQVEERAFADFITGKITEMRAGEQNIDWTNGASTVYSLLPNRLTARNVHTARKNVMLMLPVTFEPPGKMGRRIISLWLRSCRNYWRISSSSSQAP